MNPMVITAHYRNDPESSLIYSIVNVAHHVGKGLQSKTVYRPAIICDYSHGEKDQNPCYNVFVYDTMDEAIHHFKLLSQLTDEQMQKLLEDAGISATPA